MEVCLPSKSRQPAIDAEYPSKQTTATWSNTVRIVSDSKGLIVEFSGQIKPAFFPVVSEGQATIDIASLHKKHLPQTIDVHEILSGLKQLLEGQWGFSALGLQRVFVASPIITRAGGFIMQLCTDQHIEANITRTFATVSSVGRATGVANVIVSARTFDHSVFVTVKLTVCVAAISESHTSTTTHAEMSNINSFIASMSKSHLGGSGSCKVLSPASKTEDGHDHADDCVQWS